MHVVPWRAFGIEFKACGTPECNPLPYRMLVKGDAARFRLVCSQCKWKSAWLKAEEHPPHLYQVNRVVSPLLFWHSYPPSPGLLNLFVDATPKLDGNEMSVDAAH